jgi:glycosyltransferase involved in cell wall biosynthesis
MSAPIRISAVIITFNEEQNIARCIASLVPVADEILVVDSFSTDRTKAICEGFNVRFLENPFEGHIQQKNYAMGQASYDVVLSLDADEELTGTLQQSILSLKKDWKENAAWRVSRLTSYCGHWIRHCGWYPDRKIRLWDRRHGKWGGINPHDKVIVDPEISVENLNGDMRHYTYHSLQEHITQMNKFSDIASLEAHKRGKKVIVWWHIALYPVFTFFRNYLFKLGFLDGYYGFIVCFNSGYYRFLKYSKLNELNKKRR